MSTPTDDEGLGLVSSGGAAGPGNAGPRRRKKRRWPLRLLITLLVVVVVAAAAGGLYALSIDRSVSQNIKRADNLPPDEPTAPGQSPRPKKDTDDKSLNFVLMGSDSRDPSKMQDNGRSDTLMIMHLDSDRKGAYIVSFPRDMYVDIPGKGKNKINAAYSFGGPQLAVATLEQLTGTRMDHVAQVNFEGFISLTETLGGVTVQNKHAFKSHGYSYPKGKITIQGEEALWFVRERHHLPNGDLDRSANQRKVVQAIMAKGLSSDTIRNPMKFNSFVSGVAKDVTVDNKLTNSDIRNTALSLRLSPSDIKQIQAPISGFDNVSGVGSIDVVDETKMKALGKALKNDKLADYVEKYGE
ncbi:LCP family protein [Microlunatus soli]|uniref:Cell envelope-related function transcriptional attenuator common domain-containing protein n=1 Tax=Microlunatus soli TaxID=630515 RepID=A0A1H1UNH6_9ACTN|nr:LCP family protein [Microlunatus soli]SDS73756.1 cell envelope-related function transcriptional attenuator common domain-containing protein [Microlunatus soli]